MLQAPSSAQPSLQVPTPVLPPVEPTDEIRLAGTILSVVGTMIVVQVGLPCCTMKPFAHV